MKTRQTYGWPLALIMVLSACNNGVDSPAQQEAPSGSGPQGLTITPAGFSVTQVASGLSSPTAMAFAPDGRLFVCEQGGRLRVIKNGALLSNPALTLSVNSSGERGLLGVTFDPSFAQNGYIYLYYTATSPTIHNRLSRFTASEDTVSPSSEFVLLDVDALSGATNHNGGAVHFGPDGKLYIAVGDNATGSNAQTLSNMKGKILRMNRSGTIPNDNPFFYTATGNNRTIWALGLRNPFTFAFQPGTHRMFINDVGENTWEEINDGISGSNYGWPATEGMTSNPNYRSPLFAYGHGGGTSAGCSIAGGAFYNPARVTFPSNYVGTYFFADYCGGWIRRMEPQNGNTVTLFATALSSPVDLQVASDGSLYTLERGGGVVNRIQYTANNTVAPTITSHPQNVTVAQGDTARFSVTATGTAPLSYQWQRNGTDVEGATSNTYAFTPSTGDNGATFRARVTNSAGSALSNNATLTVTTTANTAPVPVIQTPTSSTTYAGGTTLSFSGGATDAEDGTLPNSALSWRIDFHHDTHNHPFYPETSGISSGTASIPDRGETSANVWYRVYLTAKDSAGSSATVFVDVRPRVARITLATNPSGLQLTLDGQPVASGTSVDSVVGIIRAIGTTSPQTLNGTTYTFASWSDSGAQTHEVGTPASATTYTATFTATTTPPPDTGTGLRGEYYDENDFTALALTRIDPTVNFDWNISAPTTTMGVENFSVRWTGFVQPRYSQTYTFYTRSDDHVRLWVNGVLVVDNWTPHAETENSGTITLVADQKYDLRMDYRELTGNAVAKLYWSSPSQTREIIPRTRLFPPNP